MSDREKIFRGAGVTPDVVFGRFYTIDLDALPAPRRKVASARIAEEQARLAAAAEAAQRDIDGLLAAERDRNGAESDIAVLLQAHRGMLANSRLLRGAAGRISGEGLAAESAVEAEGQALAAEFSALPDPYISARANDVLAVARRLSAVLAGRPALPLSAVPPGGIVLARDLSPAETAQIDPMRIAGLVTLHGGAAGHAAVIARGLGLPAVVGIGEDILEDIAADDEVIVDGVGGRVIVAPSPVTRARYERLAARIAEDRRRLADEASLPAVMADGTRIALRANLEHPRDAARIAASGAEGIGLFRTEFLFMNRADLPSEEEQYQAMAPLVQALSPAPVTFRTLDIGGDKMAAALDRHLGDAANPAMGLRAIRLSLRHPSLLKTQFRAILRAGALGPVRILLPMVTLAEEVKAARALLCEAAAELRREGVAQAADLPPLGVMVEVPAAALSADSLAEVADFLSLGTNDLVQYALAIDRGNDQVAALYNPLHPAVLRLIHFSVAAGVRAGLTVGICGEMGADPRLTAFLIGLGIREISVGAASVARVKRRIRDLTLPAAEAQAEEILSQYDPAEIEARIHAASPGFYESAE